jgi:hypothetical protein
VDGASSILRSDEKLNFSVITLGLSRVLDIHGNILLKLILEIAMDWIHLAQDRVQWRSVLKSVLYLKVPQNR